ncbi:MAG: hypothetical protein EPN22_04800 [Nitrospirae bacterium]|nr:MAG: hypothetical protein EPN22_04800 [Nitrospirota bacterium]
MKKNRLIAAVIVLSFAAAVATNANGGRYLFFTLDKRATAKEDSNVRAAIKLFSAGIAGFYDTGGHTGGLNMFPADNLIKRRIFMDIEKLKQAGYIFVIDRDKTEIKSVSFFSPVHAVAVVDESWIMEYQERDTRRPLGKAHNVITVRYYLKKLWGKWIVLEYEVYERGDGIPPLSAGDVVRL